MQVEAGSQKLQSLLSSQDTLLTHIGFTVQEGHIRSSILQPYLSAINSVHEDFWFDKPARTSCASDYTTIRPFTGHSLCRGGVSATHSINVSLPRIMAWVLLTDMRTAISYIDISVMPSDSVWFFFGNLIPNQGDISPPFS